MLNTNRISKIHINEIVSPISKELTRVNSELKSILGEFNLVPEFGSLILKQKEADSLVRQAMLLLTVKAMGKTSIDKELLRLCAATEIIYSAINLHDGIGNSEQEGGAVLNGDTLHTLGLLVASAIFPKNLLLDITRLIEKSCYRKISEEIRNPVFESSEHYLESLKTSTSEYTSIFSFLCAYALKSSVSDAAILEKCGYSLGMLYQIISDQKAGRVGIEGFSPSNSVRQYTQEAESVISELRGSVYKKKLLKLIKLLYNNLQLKAG